jgi:SAM-dependent methyltransferase
MDLIERANVIGFHRRRLGGTLLHALGWRSEASQQLRFETLCAIGDLNHSTVLDLGCGYGDLRAFLGSRYADFVYLGLEQMTEFVDEAQNRYSHLPNTHFLQVDFLNVVFPKVDYALASGAFGYRSSNSLYPFDVISELWGAVSKGLAFNMLDASVFQENDILAGRDVEDVMSFCRCLDPNAELVRGYLPDDFTVLMRRG